MPFYFKILLGLFVLSLVSASIRRLPKFRNRIISLSKEKREKLVHSWVRLNKFYKIFFILSPLYLFIIPYALYSYRPQEFIYETALMIMMYLLIFEDFLFRKAILKAWQERETKELNSSP